MKLVLLFLQFIQKIVLVLTILVIVLSIYCNAYAATHPVVDSNPYLTPETMLLSFLGFIIRWLFHLVRAQSKLKDKFSFTEYVFKNAYTVVLSFLCTIALFILVPFGLQYLGWFEYWKPISFFCGTSNIEIVEILKNRFVKTVEQKSGSGLQSETNTNDLQ